MKTVVISLLAVGIFFSSTALFTTDAQARRRDKQGALWERDEQIGSTDYKMCFYKVVSNNYRFSTRHKGPICPTHIYYDMESNTYCTPSPYNSYCNDW